MSTTGKVDLNEFMSVWKRIEDEMNWEKIHKTMIALGWTYHDGAPTIDRLKKGVKEKLYNIMKINVNGTFSQSSGGFKVTKFFYEGKKNGYHVEFVIDYVDINCGLDEFCKIDS